jgi:hypothetical protein
MYKKVSIPKAGDGAGSAAIKDPTIILIDVADIQTEPTRSHGDVSLKGDLTLKEGATGIGIYATPSSVEITEEYSGEADARGVMQGIKFEHPGNSVQIKNFTEANLNRSFVALVKECDGTETGRCHYVGSKCNPLSLTPETTNTKEANKRAFTFKQEVSGRFLAGEYSGAIPELAAEHTENAGTEEGA